MTDNHGYHTPTEGTTDWHIPLNENFESIDAGVEVRDVEANVTNYTPKQNAKFLATDTGDVFLGDGSTWSKIGSIKDTSGGSGSGELLATGEKVICVYPHAGETYYEVPAERDGDLFATLQTINDNAVSSDEIAKVELPGGGFEVSPPLVWELGADIIGAGGGYFSGDNHGTHIVVSSDPNGHCIILRNREVRLEGFKLFGSGGSFTDAGILFDDIGGRSLVAHVGIDDMAGAAITMTGGAHNIVVDQCHFRRNNGADTADGIVEMINTGAHPNYCTIRDTDISHNHGTGAAIYLHQNDGTLLTGTVMEGNDGPGVESVGTETLRIENCDFEANNSASTGDNERDANLIIGSGDSCGYWSVVGCTFRNQGSTEQSITLGRDGGGAHYGTISACRMYRSAGSGYDIRSFGSVSDVTMFSVDMDNGIEDTSGINVL